LKTVVAGHYSLSLACAFEFKGLKNTNPQPHIGKIYHLTGPQSENMHFYEQE